MDRAWHSSPAHAARHTELFAPYVYRGTDGIQRMNIDQTVYDWYRDPRYTWFTAPKKAGRGVWSEPYFDVGAGGILMSTYSAPFKTGDKFGGVCTVDIDLPRLRETVGRDIDAELDFVILAADGRYVFHPDSARIMVDTMFEYLEKSGHSRVVPAARRMLDGKPGAVWLDGWDSNEPLGAFFAPIPSTGWMFVSRVPRASVMADVRRRTLVNAGALATTLLLGVRGNLLCRRTHCRAYFVTRTRCPANQRRRSQCAHRRKIVDRRNSQSGDEFQSHDG